MSEWIKSNTDLSDHPKTYVLSSLLSVPVPYVIGTLHLLWYFTLKFAWEDGDLSRFGPIAVSRACQWDKDPNILIEALQKAKFLDEMKVHDWHDFAGRLVKDRIRYKEHNVRNTSVIRPEPVSKSRVEKSRVEYLPQQEPSLPAVKQTKSHFVKPTATEASEYARSIGFELDGSNFVDHYDARGWQFKNSQPMKDWKAAVRTWKKNNIKVVQKKNDSPAWMNQ